MTVNDDKMAKYLTFILNAQEYGMPIANVIEINRVGDIARVPHTPPYVAGVMNLRGKVIPVVNLRLKFGFEAVPFTKETCIIVVDGSAGQVGAIVDQVTGVVEFSAAQVDAPPAMAAHEQLNFIIGLGKLEAKVVILINAVHLLSKEQLSSATALNMQELQAAAALAAAA